MNGNSGGKVQLQFNRNAFGELRDRVGQNRLASVGVHMQHYIRNKLQGARTGREYRHPYGGWYTASAPGEPPARRLGDLQQSIRWEITEDNDGLTVAVGTHLNYGIILEKGSYYIDPRPWLHSSFVENADTIQDLMARPWN